MTIELLCHRSAVCNSSNFYIVQTTETEIMHSFPSSCILFFCFHLHSSYMSIMLSKFLSPDLFFSELNWHVVS